MDILEIEMIKTSNSVIVNEIHFFINENNIKVDFMENAKNILQLDTVINEAGFNVKVTKSCTSFLLLTYANKTNLDVKSISMVKQ